MSKLTDYRLPPVGILMPTILRFEGSNGNDFNGPLLYALYVCAGLMRSKVHFQLYRADSEQVLLTYNKFGVDATNDLDGVLEAFTEILAQERLEGVNEVRAYMQDMEELLTTERRLAQGHKVISEELRLLIETYTGEPLKVTQNALLKESAPVTQPSESQKVLTALREESSIPAAVPTSPAKNNERRITENIEGTPPRKAPTSTPTPEPKPSEEGAVEEVNLAPPSRNRSQDFRRRGR